MLGSDAAEVIRSGVGGEDGDDAWGLGVSDSGTEEGRALLLAVRFSDDLTVAASPSAAEPPLIATSIVAAPCFSRLMNRSKNGATSVADLTDDLIIEILSLLPVKSVCRFKCVSRLWYSLISHPEHRKRLPQTISGFFYPKHRLNDEYDVITFPTFDGISRDQEQLFPDSSLPFLTGYRHILPKDCCNGLIFCLCWKDSPIDEADYVILEDDEDYGYISGVNIYSSETGAWSYKENGWGDNEIQIVEMRGVFFNGMMHLLTREFKILAVDTEVWILEDYNGNEWIFKYNISTSQLFGELFGEKDVTLQQDYADLLLQRDYALIAIHPECNLIFFVWRCEDVLLSYDMDRDKSGSLTPGWRLTVVTDNYMESFTSVGPSVITTKP
nr:uncharacterized protein LOC109768138 [Aegilops tauschii subsp. strangulata]